ncbi:lipoprotein YvcA [Bacillus atrophaeus]|uniref:lipoprotein YvcA n=1 Tax=Bacillus atrophaeus TaxID=1452 RepID=UPI0022808FE8|nr:lipoprotein YvcA [Bacillus atrophaeus]MCY8857835.1 lipoprotein YvcA [Bacillus atrophaeus]
MKKIFFICFTLLLALTGGCSMNDKQNQNGQDGEKTEAVKPKDMDPKDLPQVPAFQDKKTREYMVSAKEEEPGYYLLESKLKGFRMLFPEDGEYDDYLSSKSINEEIISFYSYDKNTNIQFNGKTEYYRHQSFINDPDEALEQVRKDNSYKGNFERSEDNDKDMYFAYMKRVYDDIDSKYNSTHSYIGYIKSKRESNVGIEFTFDFTCQKGDQPCSLNKEDIQKKAKKIVNSITFLKGKKESQDGK